MPLSLKWVSARDHLPAVPGGPALPKELPMGSVDAPIQTVLLEVTRVPVPSIWSPYTASEDERRNLEETL